MDYSNDSVWRLTQQYLPQANRLSNDTMPEEYFLDLPGMKVHMDHYRVENPKARIILFHGVGGNGRLMSFIALPLMKRGYEIICPDLPLYGYTEYTGTITYDIWVSCGIHIVKEFHKDNTPVFIFGLSAGGMLAYQVANAFSDLNGVIVSCILDQRNKYITKKTARSPLIAAVGNALISFLHIIIGSLKVPMKMVANMKMITNNKEFAEFLMKDKRSSGASVPLAFVYSMLHPDIKTEPEDFTVCPVLLVHPGDDRWTDISLSKIFYDRLTCEKELKILEGAGHFPIEEKGLKQMEEYCSSFIEKHIK